MARKTKKTNKKEAEALPEATKKLNGTVKKQKKEQEQEEIKTHHIEIDTHDDNLELILDNFKNERYDNVHDLPPTIKTVVYYEEGPIKRTILYINFNEVIDSNNSLEKNKKLVLQEVNYFLRLLGECDQMKSYKAGILHDTRDYKELFKLIDGLSPIKFDDVLRKELEAEDKVPHSPKR